MRQVLFLSVLTMFSPWAGVSPADEVSEAQLLGPQESGSDAGFPGGAAPGSVSLWFARPEGVFDKVLFVYGRSDRGRGRGLWLVREDQLCFYFFGWPDDLHTKVPGGIAPNQWHQVVATYDGTTAKLYFNGQLLGSVQTHIDTAVGNKYAVGRNLVEDGREFSGRVDEVRVFHRARTAEEIRDTFAKESGTRGKVKLDTLTDEPGVEEIVFAVRQADTDGHWYANFGYHINQPERKYYHDGGRLCRLNLKTGTVTTLLADPQGGIRDPQLHYDGGKILFSYRKGGEPYYHLHEINLDGSGLRQLTDGPYDDFEPTYLPDGDIVFCSSRCNRWVPCYFTQVAVLYRCTGEGQNIRQLSANTEQENTPWVLPDGRLLYQRWEYVDRSQVGYHHLWTMNPDGSGQMVYFGNLHPDTVMLDAKPIPGTQTVVAIFSPGHGRTEHAGRVTIVDPRQGPDALAMARPINPGGSYRDPYPLSEHLFLAAGETGIWLLDDRGHQREVFQLPAEWRVGRTMVHELCPVRTRPRERILPSRTDATQATGHVVLEDVYAGRNMAGVERGEIKRLLILEILPKPYNMFSGMEPLSYGGTFLLERILGTVPVEPDGSANMELPALRPLFFVALDERGQAVKRMQSFLTVQPGEHVSCVGCHESRHHTPGPRTSVLALHRPASPVEPLSGVPDVLDFPRDIQPILDRHCVACHDYQATQRGGPMAGGVILNGDHGPVYSHSYFTLTICAQFADGRNLRKSNYPPRTIGSSGSPLVKKLDGSHYDARLTEHERSLVRLWIDTGAAYPGTYAALGTGMIGDYSRGGLDRQDLQWPSVQAARLVLQRRCGTCHQGPTALPDSLSDDRGLVPWGEGPMNQLALRISQRNNPVFRFSRHLLYNLSRPEQSLQLLAPLAKQAGGCELCKSNGTAEAGTAPVFTSTSDPDYQALLQAIQAGRERLNTIRRFDMPGFRPSEHYVREMQRYGILPAGPDSADPIDVYRTDRDYWTSLWHHPPGVSPR